MNPVIIATCQQCALRFTKAMGIKYPHIFTGEDNDPHGGRADSVIFLKNWSDMGQERIQKVRMRIRDYVDADVVVLHESGRDIERDLSTGFIHAPETERIEL